MGNVNIATARAGNVIGGGDWSENRLIPDTVNCWLENKTLEIKSFCHLFMAICS